MFDEFGDLTEKGKKIIKRIIKISIFVLVVFIGLSIFFSSTPTGKRIWNDWWHEVKEADDETNYETLKEVEDTCRSMISSYNADKLTYVQYKDES